MTTKINYNQINGAPVNVLDYGAVGDGVADDTVAIQAAIDAAVTAGVPLDFPAGTYLISASLSHLTQDLYSTFPENGIQWKGAGEGRTILKAKSGFSAGTAMINLDGNENNNDEPATAVAQFFNSIEGFTLDGNGVADRGIRLRAVQYSSFKNIDIHDIDGGVNDGAIYIAGTTTPTKDDADTTSGCVFENVRIDTCNGYGVVAQNSRTGSLKFTNLDVRRCVFDGMRMAFAGLELNNCTFATNGNTGSATTGGFSAVQALTGAVNRGLVINECQFEDNFWHEINIDYCYGFSIIGGCSAPYVHGADVNTSQAIIKFGTTSAEGGTVQGFRVQDYTSGANPIIGVSVGAGGVDIDVSGISLNSTSFNTVAKRFSVNASAVGITYNGYAISPTHNIPSFMCYGTTNAAAAATLVNGVEFTTSAYFTAVGVTVDHNNGSHLATSADAAGGIFTAPYAGFYEFTIKFSVIGNDASHRALTAKIIKNIAGSAVRYVVANVPLISPPATDTWMVGGSIQLKLAAGDTISGGILLSGGINDASIDRTLIGSFMFSGRAF